MKSKTKPAVKKRPDRTQRRRDLLGTVYTVISESGIEGASMRQIADRANVSTGTINYHFGNKHKLIMAALQAAYLAPPDHGVSAKSPLAQLKVFAFHHIFRPSTDRFWRFWVNCAAAGTRDAELRKHQNRRFEKQRDVWTTLILEAMDAGELPSSPNAQVIAEQLMIFAHGLVMRQILQPGHDTRLHCEKLLQKYFEALERPKPN